MTDALNEDPQSPSRHLVNPALLPILEAFPQFDLNDEFIAALREGAGMESGFMAQPLPPELEAVERREVFVSGLNGAPDVRVLLYTPPGEAQAARPVYLHIHGGGYVLGSPDMNDASNRATALAHSCIVASVDYRLAPETRWPGALEDCYAALRWLHEQAGTLCLDTRRIAVGGESAGGGHAVALALMVRDRGEYSLCLQLLDSPMLDDRTGNRPDAHPFTGEFVWTPAQNRYGWSALLGVAAGGPDVTPAAVPGRADNLADLPPAFITIGTLDLFLEESLDYTRRLTRAGVPVELHVTPGSFHGAGMVGATVPAIAREMRLRQEALATAFTKR